MLAFFVVSPALDKVKFKLIFVMDVKSVTGVIVLIKRILSPCVFSCCSRDTPIVSAYDAFAFTATQLIPAAANTVENSIRDLIFFIHYLLLTTE